jgi:hypothetical protein
MRFFRKPHLLKLRLLRSRAGASSLATSDLTAFCAAIINSYRKPQ